MTAPHRQAKYSHFSGAVLEEVRFPDIDIRQDALVRWKLSRAPEWLEIQEAISATIAHLNPIATSDGWMYGIEAPPGVGHCLFYASLAYHFLGEFASVERGFGVGMTALAMRNADGMVVIGEKISAMSLLTGGGYHAWAGFRWKNRSYIVDLSYFWFHHGDNGKEKITGPDLLAVVDQESAISKGMFYSSSEEAIDWSMALVSPKSLDDTAFPLAVAYLRRRIQPSGLQRLWEMVGRFVRAIRRLGVRH